MIPFRKKKKKSKIHFKVSVERGDGSPRGEGIGYRDAGNTQRYLKNVGCGFQRKKKSRNNSDIWDPGEYMNK